LGFALFLIGFFCWVRADTCFTIDRKNGGCFIPILKVKTLDEGLKLLESWGDWEQVGTCWDYRIRRGYGWLRFKRTKKINLSFEISNMRAWGWSLHFKDKEIEFRTDTYKRNGFTFRRACHGE
jgi:hypothetical protein